MKIYYVIPPKGVTFKAAAEAQVHFEQGHAWQCTGWAEVNDRGTIVSTCKFNQAIPKRYTEGDQVKLGEDDDDVLHVPNTWAVQWKPGRVTFLRYRVQGGQRKVSLDYGRGRMVDLREERKTSWSAWAGSLPVAARCSATPRTAVGGDRTGSTTTSSPGCLAA